MARIAAADYLRRKDVDMGSTYETDSTKKSDRLELALQAAVIVKSVGDLVGCRSWLVARRALQDLRKLVGELAKTVEDASK